MSRKPVIVFSPVLLLGWCGWLIISWLVQLMIDGPSWAADQPLLPPVRWMLEAMMVGMGLIWPAWRLSIVPRAPPLPARLPTPAPSPAGRVFSDALGMMLINQAVLWLVRVMVQWSPLQTALIDLTFAVWLLPVALCIYVGRRWDTPPHRTWAMVLCVLTLTAGIWLSVLSGVRLVQWTPFHMLWMLKNPLAYRIPTSAILARLGIVGGVSLIAWTFVALISVKSRRQWAHAR